MVDARDNPDNPKQRYGILKPSAEFTPPAAEVWLNVAMQEGAGKYGPFNWRVKPIEAGTYISAAKRHLNAWFSGEVYDPKTGNHHLGYAMACCAILIDAELNSCMIDNRPHDGGTFVSLLASLTREPPPLDPPVKAVAPRAVPAYEEQVNDNGEVTGLVSRLNAAEG